MSRELHDDLSQKLGKLQFDVETVYQRLPRDYQEIRDRMWIIRDQLATFSEDVRRIAHDLHPSMLDHLGLVVALRSLTREFTSREKIAVRLVASQVPEKLPLDIKCAVYRVVQEAIRNVAKHAGKTTVRVRLARRRSCLIVLVRDRGVGFDSRSVQSKRGLGLVSMQERVHLVHGDFLLRASPGRGVAILLRIPLSQELC